MARLSRTNGFRPMCCPSSRGAAHAGAFPLDDQAAFQLGDGAMITTMARPSGPAVSMLSLKADELDVDSVSVRPTPPGSDAWSERCDHTPRSSPRRTGRGGASAMMASSPGPFGLQAGDSCLVFLDDRIAAAGGHLTQIEDLRLGF